VADESTKREGVIWRTIRHGGRRIAVPIRVSAAAVGRTAARGGKYILGAPGGAKRYAAMQKEKAKARVAAADVSDVATRIASTAAKVTELPISWGLDYLAREAERHLAERSVAREEALRKRLRRPLGAIQTIITGGEPRMGLLTNPIERRSKLRRGFEREHILSEVKSLRDNLRRIGQENSPLGQAIMAEHMTNLLKTMENEGGMQLAHYKSEYRRIARELERQRATRARERVD